MGRVVLGIPGGQGVGGQGQNVSVAFGVIHVLADVLDRFVEFLRPQAAVQKRPGHVAGQQQLGIAHVRDGLAVRGADVGPGAVVLVLLAHEPLLRPVDDALVDRIDLGHVVKLLQAVGAEPDQGRAAAPPVEAAARPLEGQQFLVADVEVLLGLHQELRIGHTGLLHVIHDQNVRVRG